jgi:hypothetical protein
MENNEQVIENVTEAKGEQKGVDWSLSAITGAAIGSAITQLADKNLYYIGIGAGLLFGKKTAFKTVGTLIGIGTIWNTARYMTGEWSKDK